MATTIYKFQSDLTGLINLNAQLERANANLMTLKANTVQYAAQSKAVSGIATTMNTNTAAIRRTSAATATLNTRGHRMVAIFKSASIAIVSAFAFRAIIGGISGVVKSFAKFEAQMAAVKAISGASEEQFKELTDSARELGETTVFTATEVGKLQEEFARLGFTTPEILAAQQATLDLAAATGENLKSAAAIAGSSLRAFGLEAEQIVRVTNVMGASFTGSALNLERFTQSMKFAAPVAKTAGFTIEETGAMLMVLADAGLHGSIAGNALKNIFLRLGDANSKLNKSLGFTVQGLPQLIEEMKKMKAATFDLTDATELLDKRSAPAFLVLLRNIDELELQLDVLNEAEGNISRMAAIRLDTLAGDFTLLQSATEGLGIAIGEVFDFSMRKSIQSLTAWVQALTQNEKAIKRIRKFFNAVSTAIKFLIYRFIALKAISLVVALNTFSLSAAWATFSATMVTATAGATGLTWAMKGLRAVIASTPIGLLVVGLGMLVGYMTDLSDETDEAAHAMDRLNESFNKELSEATQLNEVSSERHDKLREIVATYEQLLKNIDLEILNNKELIILQKILNDGALKGHEKQIQNIQVLIDKHQKVIDKIHEEHGVIISSLKQQREMRLHADEDADVTTFDTEIAIQEGLMEKKIEWDKNMLDGYKIKIEEYKVLYQEEFDGLADSHGLTLSQEGSFRLQKRNEYLAQLEDFRLLKFGQQEISEKEHIQKLADMELAAQIAELDIKIVKATEEKKTELVAAMTTLRTKLKKRENEQSKDFLGKFEKEGEDMNVQLSEYRKFVSNLNKIMQKSSRDTDKALVGFKLNKTKDRLKELLDFQVKTINDVFEKEMETAKKTFDAKNDKFTKEKALIETNLKSIRQLMTQSSDKQIRADLKANRTKYDVLKNLDQKAWARLMKGKDVDHKEYLALLQKMLDEEVVKEDRNGKLIKALKDFYANETEKIKLANEKKLTDFDNAKATAELSKLDSNLMNFGKTQKAKLALAQKLHDDEVKHLDKMLDKKLISEEKYNMLIAQSAEKLLAAKNSNEDAYLAKIKETYSQVAALIMDAASNAFDFQIHKIEEAHEFAVTDKENEFERQLEIAEAAGGDTEAMQRTHDDKMEAMEEKKEERVRAIKKKAFIIEKANAIIMAIINGAQAITKVSGQLGIAAIVGAPWMAGLIAAQIAVIASKKFIGAKGGIIPGGDEKYADGGMVQGASHAQGGVKFGVGGRVVELEGGEAVINKRSTAMFHAQLSAMNQAGGGKRFAEGGITPGTRAVLNSAKETWTARDIANLISSSINEQQVYVTESDITTTQQVVNISEGMSTIFK